MGNKPFEQRSANILQVDTQPPVAYFTNIFQQYNDREMSIRSSFLLALSYHFLSYVGKYE